MKLPISTLFHKKDAPSYYLVLLLHDEKAHAVIVQETDGKLSVVGDGQERFSTTIEEVQTDELLDVLDKTIGKAEDPLPSNIETHKTIFGVKESWVEDKKIKKDYLTKLKHVCGELSLEPTGFLVITEAIVHLIQEEESAPVTALLTHIGTRRVSVALLRVGRLLETKRSLIDDSPVKTVDTLLKHIETADILPTRIIVYSDNPEGALAQEFISHQWSKSLSFLHVPQVALLPQGFDAKAVIYGAASQLGFEVVGSSLEVKKEDIKTLEAEAKHPSKHHAHETEAEETTDVIPTVAEATAFGFVSEKDIADEPQDIATQAEQPTDDETKEKQPKEDDPEDKHYKVNRYSDTAITDDFATALGDNPRKKDNEEKETDGIDSETPEDLPREKNKSLPQLAILKSIAGTPLRMLGGLGASMKTGNKLAFLLPPVIILALIGLFVYYIFNVKATVTLSVKPRVVDHDQDMTFSLENGNDFNNGVVQAKAVTATEDGSVDTPATGKKQTGDPAKGTVTLYNSSSGQKSLSKGTTITSSNNLDFTLDKDVTIASASGDIFTGTKPGTTDTTVTAKTFGTEYNLPSNTKFSVSGTGDVAAKNSSAFSGGTKKDVTVVAKADIEKVDVDLPKSLEEKAREDIGKKIAGDDVLLPSFLDTTISKKGYNKNLGDETKTLTLKGSVTFDSASYKKTDLDSYAQAVIKDKYLQDLALSDGNITTTLKDTKKKSDTEIAASMHITASLLPKIDNDKIINDLKGKSVTEAKDQLAKLPQVANVTFKMSPPIPFLSNTLPRFTKNIHVLITTQ